MVQCKVVKVHTLILSSISISLRAITGPASRARTVNANDTPAHEPARVRLLNKLIFSPRLVSSSMQVVRLVYTPNLNN
ncbi:hypothetical protein HanIR_Chr01g0050061 [Helianthus annuus]|nr:hypothetical protein HanIR_Chr01g0050061 [Helianthus annuus]